MNPVPPTLLPVFAAFAFFACAASTALRAATPPALPEYLPAEVRGTLDALPGGGETDLDECSGIVASRDHPGILWMHDDSFDTASWILAFDTHARFVRRFKFLDHPAEDFEDITLGRGPADDGITYLYCGAIGDNHSQRSEIYVYRLPEPTELAPGDDIDVTTGVVRLTFRYPDGPHNAETLLMDPEGNLYIVTKQPIAPVFAVRRADLDRAAREPVTLERVATVPGQFIQGNLHVGKNRDGHIAGPTGGDISPDGNLIAIKNIFEAFIWRTLPAPTAANPWSRWAATLSPRGPEVMEPVAHLHRIPPFLPPVEAPTNIGRGEALAFQADGHGYYCASEGHHRPLFYFPEKRE